MSAILDIKLVISTNGLTIDEQIHILSGQPKLADMPFQRAFDQVRALQNMSTEEFNELMRNARKLGNEVSHE